MSKNAIPAVIGIIFTIIQAFIPLSDSEVALNNRMIAALCFAALWILYAIFSDPIEKWVLRSFLGRHTQKRSLNEKIDYFHNTIIALTSSLCEKTIDKNTNHFTQKVYYHNWCEVIDFISMDCCCAGNIIDRTVVSSQTQRYAGSQRCRSIDVFYLKSIIDVLCEFKKNKQIQAEVDFRIYCDRLDDIKSTIESEINRA